MGGAPCPGWKKYNIDSDAIKNSTDKALEAEHAAIGNVTEAAVDDIMEALGKAEDAIWRVKGEVKKLYLGTGAPKSSKVVLSSSHEHRRHNDLGKHMDNKLYHQLSTENLLRSAKGKKELKLEKCWEKHGHALYCMKEQCIAENNKCTASGDCCDDMTCAIKDEDADGFYSYICKKK